MRRAGGVSRTELDTLYSRLNRRCFVHPDPLEFLYAYPDIRDREIVALVASSLAYGRVAQILASVDRALKPMGHSPASFLENASLPSLRQTFSGFVHRFARGNHLAALLYGAALAIRRFGSLQACFSDGLTSGEPTPVTALAAFARQLTRDTGGQAGHLLPRPERGSACKRLNLFLRWLVRKDAVDPGGWSGIPASGLVVPLDTHMHRLGAMFGFTARRQADMRTALEITHGFKALVREDPVRYDFALTRLGIWGELDYKSSTRIPWALPSIISRAAR